MVLRFDNDNKVICNPVVAKVGNAAPIGFIDMKGVQVTPQLHGRIRLIDGLPAWAGRPNGGGFDRMRRDRKPFIYVERLIH